MSQIQKRLAKTHQVNQARRKTRRNKRRRRKKAKVTSLIRKMRIRASRALSWAKRKLFPNLRKRVKKRGNFRKTSSQRFRQKSREASVASFCD